MIHLTFRSYLRAPVLFATAALCDLAMAGACGSAESAAQTTANSSEPQATSALYHDWQLRCVTAQSGETAGRRTCELVGTVPTADGKGVVARVVIGQPDKTKPTQMIVQLAPGVWLPDGVSLQVPGVEAPVTAQFKQCRQVCFAQAELDESVVSAMKASAKPATLGFTDETRQGVRLHLSLSGFSAALSASE